MDSDLERDTSRTAPVPGDGDNRYKSVQAKLKTLGMAIDDAAFELDDLLRDMRANANRAAGLAGAIEGAELDKKFVELSNHVAVALGGAAVQVRKLTGTAQEAADLTYQTKSTHSKLYGALDDIRSTRRERTPRPGFFTR
ncbi:conjugal transfer protein TraB [Streptomyces sp. NPDC057445]|uniref:conjugal transfer protein TraB n=1 Tax=Streptomyces sp. NPDC057445 TaxID=3346136 RepID=UPI0036C34CE9